MICFINENNKKYDWIFLWLTLAAAVRIISYAGILLFAPHDFEAPNHFSIFLDVVMYTAIILYIVYRFKLGRNVSIEPLLIKFSVTMTSTIIRSREAPMVQFVLMALVVMLAPYAAGGIKNAENFKKSKIIMSIVMLLTVATSVIEIIHEPHDLLELEKRFYVYDAFNIVVEWLAICVLYCLSHKIDAEKLLKNKSEKK